MGMTPAEVDRMSLAQWIAVCDGWNEAHSTGDEAPPAPTAEEYRAIVGKRR